MLAEAKVVRDDWRRFSKWLWPAVVWSPDQASMIQSFEDNRQTFVVAANEQGKDFAAAFCAVRRFLTRRECRGVITSVAGNHLGILWGEIERFIYTSRIPLTVDRGGPLEVLNREIYKVKNGKRCPISYIKAMVAEEETKMAGHHAAHTFFMGDEASGLKDGYFSQALGWADKFLIFGNANPCQNFYRKAIKGGDVFVNGMCFRKIIRMKAANSPNVMARRRVMPGVMTWDDYQLHRATWDVMKQKTHLDAEFWEGASISWFPQDWLDHAEELARWLVEVRRGPFYMGVDPAQGGDDSTWAVVDSMGVYRLVAKKTADTNDVFNTTIQLMDEFGIEAPNVIFDLGNGGQVHVDRLRAAGRRVRGVGFGEGVTPQLRAGPTSLREKKEQREDRYVYVDRRSEMYGEFRNLLNPQGLNKFRVGGVEYTGFGLPVGGEWDELRRQMAPIPLTPDNVGRLRLLPKHKPNGETDEETLVGLIGRSPDHLDAVVMAVWGMLNKPRVVKMGVG